VLWQELADETVANLTSTSPEQLIAVLTDLADSVRTFATGGEQD
jgi:hypothetical protein